MINKSSYTEEELWSEYSSNATYYSNRHFAWRTPTPDRSFFESIKDDIVGNLRFRAAKYELYSEFADYLSNKPQLMFEEACALFLDEDGYLPNSRTVVLDAAARNLNLLKYCDARFCNDPEVLLVAAVNDSISGALCYLDNNYGFIPENVAHGGCYDYETIEPLRKLKALVEAQKASMALVKPKTKTKL